MSFALSNKRKRNGQQLKGRIVAGSFLPHKPIARTQKCHPKQAYDAEERNYTQIKGRQAGGFQTGEFPDLDVSLLFCPFLSFLGLSRFFRDFPEICSGMVRGFSRFVPFPFLGLLRAPTRNSPERVRDTIRTFPEKSGKPPGLETPRFSFSQTKKISNQTLFFLQEIRC